jgi:FMN phosphatase YigB (HAD superfamily)
MRGILLDLDDTLIDDRASTRSALEAFMVAHRIERREEQSASWREIAARHWLRYEAGEVGFLEQRRCRVRDFLGRNLSDEEADEAFLPYANAYERSWRLFPWVAGFLEKTRDIPKVIITESATSQNQGYWACGTHCWCCDTYRLRPLEAPSEHLSRRVGNTWRLSHRVFDGR